MLKTSVEGKEVRIGFHHSQEPGWYIREQAVRGYTTCVIKLGTREAPEGEFVGEAYCSKLDVFNKEVGRKIALARALNNAKFDRNVRKQIWQTYFARKASSQTIEVIQ